MEKQAVSIAGAKASPAERAEEATLSPRRAFVVQFREGTGDARERFAGLVEHMVSGHAAHFSSAEQLTQFMRRVLRVVGSGGSR
jgi:hypothetical protein